MSPHCFNPRHSLLLDVLNGELCTAQKSNFPTIHAGLQCSMAEERNKRELPHVVRWLPLATDNRLRSVS